MVTTGETLPVERTAPERLWASAGGSANCAEEVVAGEASAAFETLGTGAGAELSVV
jgi:hypothetical protein